jgi:His-Xaa-Ser system protein HxsD
MKSQQSTPPLAAFDSENNRVCLTVNSAVHSRESVYRAAYAFVDRCFVLLDVPAEDELSVALTGRKQLSTDGLQLLASEFGNELLAQTLRQMICEQNRPLLEAVAGRAIGGAMGPEPLLDLDALAALELDDEPFDDPLGIAVSWEEKYTKDKPGKGE